MNVKKENKFRIFFRYLIHLTGWQVSRKADYVRSSVKFAKKSLKGDLVVVEVGVLNGVNAEYMINNLNIKILYLIDPYCDANGTESMTYSKEEIGKAAVKAMKRLSKYKDVEIVFINKTSNEALKEIPEDVDFIYIDGNHTYKYVKQDIENYYKKVRAGGVIGGHDITSDGVYRAFIEFVGENKLKDYWVKSDDWIIKKQEDEE